MSVEKTIPSSGVLRLTSMVIGFMWYATFWAVGMMILIYLFGGQTEPVTNVPVEVSFILREPNEVIPGSFVGYEGALVDWVNFKGVGQINVRLSELNGRPFALLLTQMVAAVIGWLVFVYQLRRLVLNARAGEIFTPANAGHLRWLGLLLLGYPLIGMAFAWCWKLTLEIPGQDHTTFTLSPDLHVVSGLLLLVLAEVFRVGVRMQEEQELTV